MKHYRLIVVLFFASMFLLLSFLVRNVTIASAATVTTAAQPTLPTTFDNHALIFAVVVLMLFLTIGMHTSAKSGRQSAQRQREEWARTGGAPEHAWIDNSASLGANVVCFLWIAVGVYLAIAIMLGNLVWLPMFLGH